MWADVDGGTIETPACSLNETRDDEDTRLPRDLLQLLPRAIPPHLLLTVPSKGIRRRLRRSTKLPPHPPIPTARAAIPDNIAQVHGLVKVVCKLIPPAGPPLANDAAKERAAWVAAEEGLGEEEQVDGLGGGAGGDGGEEGEGGGGGVLGGGGGGAEAYGWHCGSFFLSFWRF